MFNIDTTKPIPKTDSRTVYGFGLMEVGDSVAVEIGRKALLSGAASKWKYDHPGWAYKGRSDDGEYRVWRTA